MDQHARLTQLQSLIYAVLQAHPDGLSEYELLGALAARGVDDFGSAPFANALSTFQTHFLLFHCLYALRERLRAESGVDLEIHCLKVQLRPADVGVATLPQLHDPLRGYYGDLANLVNTTADDVDVLLTDFWRRFAGYEQRDAALQVLGLEGAVTFDQIKTQYRRLVMAHHPDRGGDKAQLQAINDAMRQLKAYYR